MTSRDHYRPQDEHQVTISYFCGHDNSWLGGVEVLAKGLPALVVVSVELLTGLFAPLGDGQAERRLEHERLRERMCHYTTHTYTHHQLPAVAPETPVMG